MKIRSFTLILLASVIVAGCSSPTAPSAAIPGHLNWNKTAAGCTPTQPIPVTAGVLDKTPMIPDGTPYGFPSLRNFVIASWMTITHGNIVTVFILSPEGDFALCGWAKQ